MRRNREPGEFYSPGSRALLIHARTWRINKGAGSPARICVVDTPDGETYYLAEAEAKDPKMTGFKTKNYLVEVIQPRQWNIKFLMMTFFKKCIYVMKERNLMTGTKRPHFESMVRAEMNPTPWNSITIKTQTDVVRETMAHYDMMQNIAACEDALARWPRRSR